MTNDELRAIEELNAARTPGVWVARSGELCHEPKRGGVCPVRIFGDNLAFIAACSTAVPALLAELKRVKQSAGVDRAGAEELSCSLADRREEVKLLREALSWAVGYIRCQKPNAEADYPDMRNAATLADAAPIYSGEFHRMMCRAEVAEEEARRLQTERDALRRECADLRARDWIIKE